MKTPKSLFVMALLGLQITSTAQVQWYQNQDGDGTSANSILPLTKRSFIASYFWSIEGSNYTWKISKSNFNGEELKTFFVSGTGANIDIKTGAKNSIFILVRNYVSYIYPENTIYKLDTNLNIIKQKLISIPNGFGIYSVNAFDVDEDDNIYLVGDGVQNSETNPASFVMKLNKNLVNSWTRIDAIPTTYSDVHTDHNGSLFVISDDYAINPDLAYMKVRAFNGGLLRKDTVHFNFTRWSLSSQVDGNGDLILYGIKAANSFDQSVYLCKLSGRRGNIFFRKEYFSSVSTQLQDFKLDREGNMYALISHFYLPDSTVCSVSRISRFNGWTNWNHSFTMSRDSTNFLKLVNNDRDFIYAVGEKKCQGIFSKGIVSKFRRINGAILNTEAGPDSTIYDKSHWLVDGVVTPDENIVGLGNTTDIDPNSYNSSYSRAFTVLFGGKIHHGNNCNDNVNALVAVPEDASVQKPISFSVYPNPVQNELYLTSTDVEGFDKASVYSLQGKLIRQVQVTEGATIIDVSSMPAGSYIIILQNSNGSKLKSGKFIIQH